MVETTGTRALADCHLPGVVEGAIDARRIGAGRTNARRTRGAGRAFSEGPVAHSPAKLIPA